MCYKGETVRLSDVRILFLSPRQCWPARSGAKLREYHFVRALAQRGPLTYVHFTDPGTEALTRKDLPFCHQVIAVPKPSAYGPVNLIRGVLGRWPLPVLNYTSAQMSAAVDRLGEAESFDLIHLDAIHMVRYAEWIVKRREHAAKIVYNWHNIESELMRRFGDGVDSLAKRWYARLTAAKLARVERDILKTAFGHVVCSPRERDALLRISPSARIAVIENGVDVASFHAEKAPTARPHKLVFVGLMDYYPNVEAATSFVLRVWPRLRERFPGMTLWIVGANPLPAVVDLGKTEGVTVTGTIPDVRPYYHEALSSIVPLRTGGGTRLKILEAMAAGVPVISTPLGAEGLLVTGGENILFADADDPNTWVSQIELLVSSGHVANALTASALELVRSTYDWDILGRKLCDTYSGWLRGEG